MCRVVAPARPVPVLEGLSADCVGGGATQAEVSLAMRRHAAAFGGGAGGRYWFGESNPVCDAIVTVAKMLQALSRSNAPLSEVVAHLTSYSSESVDRHVTN